MVPARGAITALANSRAFSRMASCSLLSRVMTAASLPLLFQRVSRPTPGRVKPRASLPPVVAGDPVLVAGAIFLEQRALLGAERGRSEERRVGQECVSTWLSRWL